MAGPGGRRRLEHLVQGGPDAGEEPGGEPEKERRGVEGEGGPVGLVTAASRLLM